MNPKSDARKLFRALKDHDLKIVFAESCTGGKLGAALSEIRGISDRLCGSFVTYRNDSKAKWLGVSRPKLQNPGPVSAVVAKQMALGALKETPEADLAVSITGHLGPDAPKRYDGVVFIGIAIRYLSGKKVKTSSVTLKKKLDYLSEDKTPEQLRLARQKSAAVLALQSAHYFIEDLVSSAS